MNVNKIKEEERGKTEGKVIRNDDCEMQVLKASP